MHRGGLPIEGLVPVRCIIPPRWRTDAPGIYHRRMKVASYIFYVLAGLAVLAGISAASFAKEQLGQIFGSGALFFYGGIAVMFGVIGLVCARLANRRY